MEDKISDIKEDIATLTANQTNIVGIMNDIKFSLNRFIDKAETEYATKEKVKILETETCEKIDEIKGDFDGYKKLIWGVFITVILSLIAALWTIAKSLIINN